MSADKKVEPATHLASVRVPRPRLGCTMNLTRRLLSCPNFLLTTAGLLFAAAGFAAETRYDIVIRDGTIFDGTGGAPYVGDLAISGDRIVAVGNVQSGAGKTEVDAHGLMVAPGF